MLLIPAIDIRHGACVRLLRGDFSDVTVYDENPLAIAQEYGRLGSSLLHIVDLDGAEAGKPVNHELVGQIAKTAGCPIQTGGGLRDLAGVAAVLQNGSGRAVVGSMAVTNPELTTELLSTFGPESVVLALDVRQRNGLFHVCTHGWTKESTMTLRQVLRNYLPHGLRHVLITDIERDGALSGPNIELYRNVVREFPGLAVQASGGIRDVVDLNELADSGVAAAISGKALLEKRIDSAGMASYLQNA